MTKIAGALNILPQTMLQQNITNPSNIHAYLHEVVGALQQILKAFLVLNIGECYCQ
jgi:hypothetical protein